MKTILVALVAVAFFVSAASAAEYPEEEDVLVLGDNNLAQALEEFEFLLVEFYAPWCGHCKRLAPEYARAATKLKEKGSKVRLAKVDATVEPNSASKYGVGGYPTLKFFINGKPIDYNGGRVEAEIISWVDKKILPSTREIHTSEELAKAVKENDVIIIFWGGKEAEGYDIFESVSKIIDEVAFVYTSNNDLKADFQVAEHTRALMLKKFDEGRNEFNSPLNPVDLKNFIEGQRHPIILPFSQKAANRIFDAATPTLLLLVKKNEAGQRAEAILREAAESLKGKILLSISDVDDADNLGPKLVEFLGVNPNDVPLIRILVPAKGGSPKKYVFENELTAQNIVKFHEDFVSGRLEPTYKSEPVPENNNEPVKVVVAKNFEEIVMDRNKDVFIEFYAPWCGHCKQLTPIWTEVAQSVSSIENLVIAKMDATANEVESVSVGSYPTLKFYPKNDKSNPIQYEGTRSKDDLLAWLKEKIT